MWRSALEVVESAVYGQSENNGVARRQEGEASRKTDMKDLERKCEEEGWASKDDV